MDQFTLARPYAKAIFEIALAEKNYDHWSYILNFLSVVVSDTRVMSLLRNATLDVNTITEFFYALCDSDFTDFKTEERNLIHILAYRRRLLIVPFIANLYEKYRAASEKTLTVELISAVPLVNAQKNQFIEKLGEYFGRTIQLECHVDSGLMGGYTVRAKNLVMDGSLKGQLNNLKKNLSGG